MKFMYYVITCCVVILLSGCGPETVIINPQLNNNTYANIGNNQRVAIQVADVRQNLIVGGRPTGIGPLSTITTSSNSMQGIHDAIANGLRNKGFIPVDSNDEQQQIKTLQVKLIDLEYKEILGPCILDVVAHSTIQVTYRNKNQYYTRIYHSDVPKTLLTSPMAWQDQEYINESISKTLEQIFNDNNLLLTLAK